MITAEMCVPFVQVDDGAVPESVAERRRRKREKKRKKAKAEL